MRSAVLTIAALAFLRIVVGLHFFLEGLAHLRDPEWSSIGFRKAAVGPLADWYRADLPETGRWSATLGAVDGRSAAEASQAWQASVVESWRRLLDDRSKLVPLSAEARQAAEQALDAAEKQLATFADGIDDDLVDYRLQVARLAGMAAMPGAADIPFERQRVAAKRKELAGLATGWMNDAAAIGKELVATWDAGLPDAAARRRAAAAVGPTSLWKSDRFVSWSLVTIGACLVLGLLTKFNAMGGVFFLASVIASQPFWVAGAQSTYDQWVEVAALLVIAAAPLGGWSGLDYFLARWCPFARCCGTCGSGQSPS